MRPRLPIGLITLLTLAWPCPSSAVLRLKAREPHEPAQTERATPRSPGALAATARAPIQIKTHHVRVTIINGFAQTESIETFFNPNDVDLEAVYTLPLPRNASLSQMSIYAGDKELKGEVLPKDKARQIYEEERDKGHDTGLAAADRTKTMTFAVSPVRARATTIVRTVYYQPLTLDTGVGRYLYPLEDGGTEEGGSFWKPNTEPAGKLVLDVDLRSAWPVADVRLPGHESEVTVKKLDQGHYRVRLERAAAGPPRDFVFYYRLADDLPGRVELVCYRADETKPGTFMLVLTPGLDLKPITHGADYTFVLDVSGSMESKLRTLARGVAKALEDLKPHDRFQIVTFNDVARRVGGPYVPATPENVKNAVGLVQGLAAGGSTNLFDGLSMGLQGLATDRATCVVLVTDGVTNAGTVDPSEFQRLLEETDVRVFGFLMGNSANWPLMELVCRTSGGFYSCVSNDDDILGQLLLAKNKITHESLHDVAIDWSGAPVIDVTDDVFRKIYHGQQLVLFGRYQRSGPAGVTLKARLTGKDQAYTTRFDFPAIDKANPELERLWAMRRIENLQARQDRGLLSSDAAEASILKLGLDYQLVTDHTSMVVAGDDAFAVRGIERRNARRVAVEHQAQAQRLTQPVQNHRVDRSKPTFNFPTPSLGRGGGALDPVSGLIGLGLAGLGLASRRRRTGGDRPHTP